MGGPGGYGAPPAPGGYAPPPGGAYGAPQGGAMVGPGQYPGGAMGAPMGMGGGGAMMGAQGGGMGGMRGEIRNPTTALLGTLFCCGMYHLFGGYGMLNELKAYTKDESLQTWHLFVPILNLLMILKLPDLVTRAKQMAGSRNPQSQGLVMYLFLFPYALAKDLNQVWDPNAAG